MVLTALQGKQHVPALFSGPAGVLEHRDLVVSLPRLHALGGVDAVFHFIALSVQYLLLPL